MDERMVQYEARKQSPVIAYILLVVFGVLGAHNFYLGRREQAMAQVVINGAVVAVLAWLFIGTGLAVPEFESAMGGVDVLVRRMRAFYTTGLIWGIGTYVWLMLNALQVPTLTAEHNRRLHRRIFAE